MQGYSSGWIAAKGIKVHNGSDWVNYTNSVTAINARSGGAWVAESWTPNTQTAPTVSLDYYDGTTVVVTASGGTAARSTYGGATSLTDIYEFKVCYWDGNSIVTISDWGTTRAATRYAARSVYSVGTVIASHPLIFYARCKANYFHSASAASSAYIFKGTPFYGYSWDYVSWGGAPNYYHTWTTYLTGYYSNASNYALTGNGVTDYQVSDPPPNSGSTGSWTITASSLNTTYWEAFTNRAVTLTQFDTYPSSWTYVNRA